jgi:hypothetical protein
MAIDQFPPFADAEEVARALLVADLAAEVKVVSATGPTVTPPTVMVRRIGGTCDNVTDFATLLASCFCSTRPESNALAAAVQAVFLNATNQSVTLPDDSVALIDNVVVMVADHPETYENPDLRQVTATYEMRMRRPRPAA